MSTVNTRKADHVIDPMFIDRWSPRAMTGASIPESELMRLFEADLHVGHDLRKRVRHRLQSTGDRV